MVDADGRNGAVKLACELIGDAPPGQIDQVRRRLEMGRSFPRH